MVEDLSALALEVRTAEAGGGIYRAVFVESEERELADVKGELLHLIKHHCLPALLEVVH